MMSELENKIQRLYMQNNIFWAMWLPSLDLDNHIGIVTKKQTKILKIMIEG